LGSLSPAAAALFSCIVLPGGVGLALRAGCLAEIAGLHLGMVLQQLGPHSWLNAGPEKDPCCLSCIIVGAV